MDRKFLILVCEAMDMNQKFLILNCLCDGNGSEISFILCDGNGLEICYVWSPGYGSEVSDPYL